jgi:hypothetical protein
LEQDVRDLKHGRGYVLESTTRGDP